MPSSSTQDSTERSRHFELLSGTALDLSQFAAFRLRRPGATISRSMQFSTRNARMTLFLPLLLGIALHSNGVSAQERPSADIQARQEMTFWESIRDSKKSALEAQDGCRAHQILRWSVDGPELQASSASHADSIEVSARYAKAGHSYIECRTTAFSTVLSQLIKASFASPIRRAEDGLTF